MPVAELLIAQVGRVRLIGLEGASEGDHEGKEPRRPRPSLVAAGGRGRFRRHGPRKAVAATGAGPAPLIHRRWGGVHVIVIFPTRGALPPRIGFGRKVCGGVSGELLAAKGMV